MSFPSMDLGKFDEEIDILRLSAEEQLRLECAKTAALSLSGYQDSIMTDRLLPKIAEQIYDYVKEGKV